MLQLARSNDRQAIRPRQRRSGPVPSEALSNAPGASAEAAPHGLVRTQTADSGIQSDLLPLRIDAAILLDRALRLKSLLSAQRRSIGSRVLRPVEKLANALRGKMRRGSAGMSEADVDLGRYAAVLLKSGLFDPDYYLRRNADVAAAGADPVVHYLQCGATELRNPSPYFSTRWYLRRYPDVADSGVNPLYHFIRFGYAEGRLALPNKPSALSATDPGSELNIAWPAFGAVAVPVLTGTGETHAPAVSTAPPPGRLVVYTSLFGSYDDLFVPSPEQARSCDFVVFTDQPNVPPPWRRGPVSYTSPSHTRQSRFYKLLPHRLFPQHEWSLYLDANIDVRMNPVEFFERYHDLGADFLLFRHPTRTNILEELGACIGQRKDDAELMVRQVAQYLQSGFKQAFPLTENNVLLRRHNDPELAALSEAWWGELKAKSRRDQLSLSYVVERKDYRRVAFFEEGRLSARSYPGLRMRPHIHQLQARDLLDDALQ